MYEVLSKYYYKEPSEYEWEYERRLNGYGTVKLPLRIKSLKSTQEFTCFYVNHNKLVMAYEKVLKNSFEIRYRTSKLPRAAISQYVSAKLVDELISTNEIEGVQSTRAEMTEALEIREKKIKRKVRFSSLINSYYNLMHDDVTKVVNIEEVRKIYDDLVQEEIKNTFQLDGEIFRKEGVEVVTATQKVIHKGVFPESSIKRGLDELFSYLNEHETPMLYKIAVAHYYFGYIHPFYDGNGRTSRYISSIYLKDELDILTALTLSYATNKLRQFYYDAFNESNNPLNKGDLTFFCSTFFKIITHAQDTIISELSEKEKELTYLQEAIEREKEHLDEEESSILFVIGQGYIYGLEDEGFSKSDLKEIFDITDYKITKILKKLFIFNDIKYVKKNPVMVTLSDSFAEKLYLTY